MLCGMFCMCCSMEKQIACGLHCFVWFFFFASRFTSLMLNEWSGWTRWGAICSELHHSTNCVGQVWESYRHYSTTQSYECLYLSLGANSSIELPLRFWWQPNVCLAGDTGLMNLTTTLHSGIKKIKASKRVCVCMYTCLYALCVAVLLFQQKQLHFLLPERSPVSSEAGAPISRFSQALTGTGLWNSKQSSWTCKLAPSNSPGFLFSKLSSSWKAHFHSCLNKPDPRELCDTLEQLRTIVL